MIEKSKRSSRRDEVKFIGVGCKDAKSYLS
jgi:hypothetical protein